MKLDPERARQRDPHHDLVSIRYARVRRRRTRRALQRRRRPEPHRRLGTSLSAPHVAGRWRSCSSASAGSRRRKSRSTCSRTRARMGSRASPGTPTGVEARTSATSVPPTVRVVKPNGYEIYLAGQVATVEWAAVDSFGVSSVDDPGFAHRPARPGGRSRPPAARNTGSFNWVVTEPGTGQAWIRVVARDAAGTPATIAAMRGSGSRRSPASSPRAAHSPSGSRASARARRGAGPDRLRGRARGAGAADRPRPPGPTGGSPRYGRQGRRSIPSAVAAAWKLGPGGTLLRALRLPRRLRPTPSRSRPLDGEHCGGHDEPVATRDRRRRRESPMSVSPISAMPAPAPDETCAQCSKTLTPSDRVASGDRAFCRSLLHRRCAPSSKTR